MADPSASKDITVQPTISADQYTTTSTADENTTSRASRDSWAGRQPSRREIRATTSQRLARRITSSDPAGDGIPPGNTSEEDEFASSVSDQVLKPVSKYDVGWRRVVRNFSPSWFSVTMGTGICSLLLITIPFQASWLYWLSVVFFVLNAILFTLAIIVSFLRYTLYPQIWKVMIRDQTMVLFISTMPMGFATLVESWIFLCCPYWGYWSVWVAWLAWMVDVLIAVAITVTLPFLLMSQNDKHGLERITAAQLLPMAATIVASGTGVEVAELLTSADHAFGTLLASYVLWGLATPLSMTVLVMYYQRLALHKLPPREVIISSLLPIGPLGMGSYTILKAGMVARIIFPRVGLFDNLAIAGDIFFIGGAFLGLIMWSFGLCWLVFGIVTIYTSPPIGFNMGWWGFTFPLGVYSISTMTFGVVFPSMVFKVLGTIFSVAVILLWCVVAIGTAKGAWNGELFHAVCLKNLPRETPTKDQSKGRITTDAEK
jgi:tellurite resistance protein TehA-like permease